MRMAIIDCGTNTFNLLIADATKEGWKVVFENKLPVKLGAGGFDRNEILPSRFVRGIDALNCHQSNIHNYEVQKTFAFATSAIREASNGHDFVAKAKNKTKIEIATIDGNQEAEFIYKGILQTVELGEEPVLIMDIGGGSTEFIIANATTIFWKKSYLLGVSRLYDMIKPSDRMSHDDSRQLKEMLDRELADLQIALKEFPCHRLIGSSGSFDTLFALYKESVNHPDKDIAPALSNDIPLSQFPTIHAWLMGSTFAQRLKHPMIPAIRAEYMPLASYLVKYILTIHKFDQLTHSSYALKEGVIQYLIETMDWPEETVKDEKPEDYLEE